MQKTVFGMPAVAVQNQLQNILLLVLGVIASRGHMSGAAIEQWSAIIGAVATLLTNHFAVSASVPPDSGRQLPNGEARSNL